MLGSLEDSLDEPALDEILVQIGAKIWQIHEDGQWEQGN